MCTYTYVCVIHFAWIYRPMYVQSDYSSYIKLEPVLLLIEHTLLSTVTLNVMCVSAQLDQCKWLELIHPGIKWSRMKQDWHFMTWQLWKVVGSSRLGGRMSPPFNTVRVVYLSSFHYYDKINIAISHSTLDLVEQTSKTSSSTQRNDCSP